MKRLALSLCLAGSSLMAAGLQNRNYVRGEYVEARTADVYTGPCYANSEAELVGNLAVFGWKVKSGSFDGVKLDGLSVVGVVKASNTLGHVHADAYPVKSVLIVDEKANPEQRLALRNFAQRMGGDLLQDVVRVDYEPVDLTFEGGNLHSAKATLTAGTLAKIQTRAINEGDHHCSNEITWYAPLTKLDHAMPAFALAHSYKGTALNTRWSSPEKRSAFVGSFQLAE
ncbi:MAG TPA: DUF1326 domain-containing protein [Bryobacteraceae bacterium]|nr:DUF1326 domain-containing protein [Bryobacteraceae bacterium]